MFRIRGFDTLKDTLGLNVYLQEESSLDRYNIIQDTDTSYATGDISNEDLFDPSYNNRVVMERELIITKSTVTLGIVAGISITSIITVPDPEELPTTYVLSVGAVTLQLQRLT